MKRIFLLLLQINLIGRENLIDNIYKEFKLNESEIKNKVIENITYHKIFEKNKFEYKTEICINDQKTNYTEINFQKLIEIIEKYCDKNKLEEIKGSKYFKDFYIRLCGFFEYDKNTCTFKKLKLCIAMDFFLQNKKDLSVNYFDEKCFIIKIIDNNIEIFNFIDNLDTSEIISLDEYKNISVEIEKKILEKKRKEQNNKIMIGIAILLTIIVSLVGGFLIFKYKK